MLATLTIDALIGAGLPFVIALLNQAHWSSTTKGVVAMAIFVLAATVTAWWQGTLHWGGAGWDWRATALTVGGAALGLYHLWWRPSGIAAKVEEATTIAP